MASSTPERQLFESRHDLDAETRTSMVEHLNQLLADTTDLQTQVKHAHWNVKGMQFQFLHQLFDEQAAILSTHADMLAERSTALGGYAPGTVRMAAESSRLDEFPVDAVDAEDCLTVLADRFASHAAHLRTGIEEADAAGDIDTSDLYTELSRAIDKQLWFLEAHLQGPHLPEHVGVPVEAED